MTEKEIQAILKAPREAVKECSRLIDKRSDLRASMLPGAIRYDIDRVQTSPHDPMAEYAERLEGINQRIDEQRERYGTAVEVLRYTINHIEDPRARYVLFARYVVGQDYTAIANDIGVSIDRVFQIRREAIFILKKL